MPGRWNARDWHAHPGMSVDSAHPGWHGAQPWGAGPPPEWRMPRWFTLWAPVVVSFLIQVPAAFVLSRINHSAPLDTAIAVVLALAGPLALIAARRLPGPVVAFTALVAFLDLYLGTSAGPPYIALAFAIVSAIARGHRLWAWISIGAGWIVAITLAVILPQQSWTPGRIAGTTFGILIVFGIGEGLRTRRERGREYRRLASERRQSAVQQERVRIARELHDVLAHSLSQINVQAGVGLHLMEKQPDKAAEALASIKETSKTALDEVRSVLGLLRAEGGDPNAPLVPEPSLDRIPGLVETSRTDTLAIDLVDSTAHAELPAPLQLALYRIVQESLTNAARHADGARHASVLIERRGASVHVEVRDDGRAATGQASEAGGRGLLGMRERAELLGGRLTAGPADGGGFAVIADIPIRNETR